MLNRDIRWLVAIMANKVSLILLLLTQLVSTKSACPSVHEVDIRTNLAANSSLIVGYTFPSCPSNYRLNRILAALVFNRATPQPKVWNVSGILSSALSNCAKLETISCPFDIPLDGINSMEKNVQTKIEVLVNYTCQLEVGFLIPGGLQANSMKTITSNRSVTYIRLEMMSSGQDWNCTISSLSGSAVSWRWISSSCPVESLECTAGNGNDVSSPLQNVTYDLCMEEKSVRRIKFLYVPFCTDWRNGEGILLDVQVESESDFEIQCFNEPPNNVGVHNRTVNKLLMKSDCDQLTWITPDPAKSQDITTASSDLPTTPLDPLESPGTGEPRYGQTMAATGSSVNNLGLGLGLGIGLGLLVVVVSAVLMVICIRRMKTDSKSEKISSDVTIDKDGGFVLTRDVFQSAHIYTELSKVTQVPANTPATNGDVVDSRAADAGDMPVTLEAGDMPVNADAGDIPVTAEAGDIPVTADAGHRPVDGEDDTAGCHRSEDASGFTTSVPAPPPPQPTVEPKRPLTLTRKLFTQIAKIAKEEEAREKQRSSTESTDSQDSGTFSAVGSQSTLVNRWLQSSSTLTGATSDDTENGIYFNRRIEFDI